MLSLMQLPQQLGSWDLLNIQGVVADNRHIIKPGGILAAPAEEWEKHETSKELLPESLHPNEYRYLNMYSWRTYMHMHRHTHACTQHLHKHACRNAHCFIFPVFLS